MELFREMNLSEGFVLKVIFLIAAYVTAFMGWFVLMPFYWFGRIAGMIDLPFKEWTKFWFALEYIG